VVFVLEVCDGGFLGWRSLVVGLCLGGLLWEVFRLEVSGGGSLSWRIVVGDFQVGGLLW
jgi:hypothetical protein